MIPQTNITDYRDFTHKLILTSIGTIILSSALTQVVTTMVIPATTPYIPAWALPLAEALVASYILYHANKKDKPKPTQKEQLLPSSNPTPTEPDQGQVIYRPFPSKDIENIFLPR